MKIKTVQCPKEKCENCEKQEANLICTKCNAVFCDTCSQFADECPYCLPPLLETYEQ